MTTKTSKKKVLFVATVDSHIELFHLPFLKYFKDNNFEVHVATNSNKPIKYCDKKIQLPISRSPFKLSNLKAIKQLRKITENEHYAIIHCHTPMGGVVTRLAAKKSRNNGTRVIYTAHGFHFYKGAPLHFWLMFYPVEKYLAKYTDTLITINQEDYTRTKKKFGKRCHDIQYVPGVGVDPKKFKKRLTAKEKNALRSSLGLKVDDVVLICIGRLDKNKNQGFLIKALSQLGKNYHLLLVGPDELNGKYQKLAKKLNLENRVHFLGFRSDIPELLQISNLAVSASKREGLPVNLIESAFASLPIVATDCRGNRDICLATNNLLSPQNDINAFVNAILRSSKVRIAHPLPTTYSLANVKAKMSKIYSKKKRVLHILASNKYSGAENVACTIIKNLSDKYDFAYCSPRGPIEDILEKRNITFLPLKKLTYKNLKKAISSYHPDIIHAHDFKASLAASCFSGQCAIISQIHKNDPAMKKNSLKSVLFLLSSKKYSKIIGVSDSIIDEFIFSDKINNKYATIANYVDEKVILRKSKEFSIGKKYDLFFFGRLSNEKNPLEFIEIVKTLNNPLLQCVMIGDGPLRNECENKIIKYHLKKNIDMIGFQPNPYPYIAASKIGIMPSKFEGYGLTAIESTILGKPVLNSGVGNLANIFSHTNSICKTIEEYNKKITASQGLELPKIDHFTKSHYRTKIMNIYNSIGNI